MRMKMEMKVKKEKRIFINLVATVRLLEITV